MAVDTVLVKSVLDVLDALGDRGRELNALASEVELRADASVTVQQVKDACEFAKRKGWASEGKDAFDRPRWYITDAGRNRRAQFGG